MLGKLDTHLRTFVLVAVLGVTGLGAQASAGSPRGGPSLFLSPTGSDSENCTQADPCRTFAHAYLVAQPGQVVEAAAGDYDPQVIPVDPSKTSEDDVVFQPAPGATVTIGCREDGVGCIDILGDHVTIKDVHVAFMPPVNGFPWQGTVDTERGSDDVTLIDIDAGSLNAVASNMTVRGGDWGPSIDPHNMRIDDECVNCVWDGMLIHDFAVAQGGHSECLTLEGGTNVIIRKSEFRSCEIFSIFAKPGGGVYKILIENNVFWNPRGLFQSNEIKFTNSAGGVCESVVIRNNVVSDDINDECGSSIDVVGDIQLAAQGDCGPGWDYNVFVDAQACGDHALTVGDARFVDAAAGDFHLLPDSPAIGRGSIENYPADDIDGQPRPLDDVDARAMRSVGPLPDAGVDEVPFEGPGSRRSPSDSAVHVGLDLARR